MERYLANVLERKHSKVTNLSYWFCCYLKNLNVEMVRFCRRDNFSEEDVQQISDWMRIAIQEARKALIAGLVSDAFCSIVMLIDG